MLGAVLSILELSLLLFVLFECHSFGFFPLFLFAKIIVSLHISSSSTLTACPHWQGNIRVCWEIRMGKDGFPRTPLSAGFPFMLSCFTLKSDFVTGFCVSSQVSASVLVPGADHASNLQLRLFPPLQSVLPTLYHT